MRLTYVGVLVAALLAISACGGATTPGGRWAFPGGC